MSGGSVSDCNNRAGRKKAAAEASLAANDTSG